MKRIIKGREPKKWTEYKNTPGAQYKSIPELVDSLLEEQGAICAYCMRRIPYKDGNSSETHRIDHISCQSNHPEDQLNYNNMVICCPGAIDNDFHCDKKKGAGNITFSPFDINFINTLRYKSSDGTIESTNNIWNNEINEVLNLNNRLLKANRLAVLNSVIDYLGKGTWTQTDIRRMIDKWDSKNSKMQYIPYCGVVLWFLNNRIKK